MVRRLHLRNVLQIACDGTIPGEAHVPTIASVNTSTSYHRIRFMYRT